MPNCYFTSQNFDNGFLEKFGHFDIKDIYKMDITDIKDIC